MQFNVAQLLKEPIGAVRRHELQEEIVGLDPDLVFLGPLVGGVQLMRTHSGVLVTAHLSTAVQVTCNRCLVPIALPIRIRIEESYRPLTEVHTGRYIPPEAYEGSAEELDDAALLIDEHHTLDISEVVRQAIWLAHPMYPSCNWPGPDECPNFVVYRQELAAASVSSIDGVESTPASAEVDPRWAALLALRGQVEEDEDK